MVGTVVRTTSAASGRGKLATYTSGPGGLDPVGIRVAEWKLHDLLAKNPEYAIFLKKILLGSQRKTGIKFGYTR